MNAPLIPQIQNLSSQDSNIPETRGLNLFDVDAHAAPMLEAYISKPLFDHVLPHFQELGRLAGGELDEHAFVADVNPPTLSVRARTGNDQAVINKHPAYVELEKAAYSRFGLAAMSHVGGALGWKETLPPAVKYSLSHLFVQAEFGLCCPVSMTDSLARTLRKYGDPQLVEQVLPQVASMDFDELRQGAMFMTEQAAGSDVSATETLAREEGDGRWRLYGDKWFCSNPDAGFAMVLARSESAEGLAGVSLFLLPRDLPDGSHNHYRILRLKDKLGTRSMASGEIRLEGAYAWLVGERGRGFQHMADMINNSRLSNGMRAAGLMRRGLTESQHVARNRRAFGKKLIDMPLMQRQLAKILMRAEQGRSIMMQTAQALQNADAGDKNAARLLRILTPLIKFRACRDARQATGDAMEVRGGCGYIEEWVEARLVRDAHLGSIWEGTSNIVALDVMRAIARNGCLQPLRAHVDFLLENGAACPAELADLQVECIDKAFRFAEETASVRDAPATRQAATALYNAVTLAALRWEAAQHEGLRSRNQIADLVLLHRLAPQDPCLPGKHEVDLPALLEAAWN
ncbi:MAG: DNA alkylation response protein [Alcaligenaceae bacterium]|nr:DNA alkylation response protein [Alcaligenaceae bacterium]